MAKARAYLCHQCFTLVASVDSEGKLRQPLLSNSQIS